jgi:hypothetical protein
LRARCEVAVFGGEMTPGTVSLWMTPDDPQARKVYGRSASG